MTDLAPEPNDASKPAPSDPTAAAGSAAPSAEPVDPSHRESDSSPKPQSPDADAQARRSRIVIVALAAAVVLVVIVALVAVFTRNSPVMYDESTPEGVVQRYSQAVVDGDIETALTYLVPEVADECDRILPDTSDRRVTLLETTERDDSARVEVIVATVYGSGPLGSNEYETEGAFTLVKAGDAWLIDSAPWELVVCSQTGAL